MTQDGPALDAPRPAEGERLLEVRDLRTSFITEDGIVGAVDGVSFSVAPGKTLGIVGESGCGKSVTMLTVMGLNPKKTARSTGQALLRGENLIGASSRRLREIRGNELAMIFQDPMTSLNPVHKIGTQLVEAILLHERGYLDRSWNGDDLVFRLSDQAMTAQEFAKMAALSPADMN